MEGNNKIFGYSVVKRLGQGSFGEVVLAEKGGEQVAIKKISKKQIIKVISLQIRLINCMNPLSKNKFSLNSINTILKFHFSSKFMILNLMMITSTLSSNTVVLALLKILFSVNHLRVRCQYERYFYSEVSS